MRLDKFLKVSRLIKRRTIANAACDAGKVLLNGKVAKAFQEVKIDDNIEIRLGQHIIKAKIIDIKDTTKKNDCTMYEIIN